MGAVLLHVQAVVLAFGVAPALGRFWVRLRPRGHAPWTHFWLGGAIGGGIGALVGGDWQDALIFAAGAVTALLWDWWNRKGKRAAKQLGEKSRAVLAGLAERVRDRLQPAPKGATA